MSQVYLQRKKRHHSRYYHISFHSLHYSMIFIRILYYVREHAFLLCIEFYSESILTSLKRKIIFPYIFQMNWKHFCVCYHLNKPYTRLFILCKILHFAKRCALPIHCILDVALYMILVVLGNQIVTNNQFFLFIYSYMFFVGYFHHSKTPYVLDLSKHHI